MLNFHRTLLYIVINIIHIITFNIILEYILYILLLSFFLKEIINVFINLYKFIIRYRNIKINNSLVIIK